MTLNKGECYSMFKRTESISFNDFMSGDYKKTKKPKNQKKLQRKAFVTGSLIPLALASPKVFASESINQCGKVLAVSAPQAIPANAITDKAMGELISAMASLFDPIIDLVVTVSFPVASAMIVFKLFMGFFRDQGEVWEGIGKISLVYVLIQMSPIFIKILKQLGTLAVGI
jgi:hypothetical protein